MTLSARGASGPSCSGSSCGSAARTRARVGSPPARGRGPGDSFSLPYFVVNDIDEALSRVEALGGRVIHPGRRWAVCKDSEGNPFGLTT